MAGVAALLTGFLLVIPVRAAAFDHTHAALTGVLRQYVRYGLVDYHGLLADPSGLDRYLAGVEVVPRAEFDGWDRSRRLAFLVNSYNAVTLRLVVDHYPVRSIKDIGGFLRGPWKQPVVRLWGRTMTLDDLEHGIIRKDYAEPRTHFALNCASRSCPALPGRAFRADELDRQLDRAGKAFLADSTRNRFDPAKRHAKLSAIFKWFADDFGGSPANVLAFVVRFAPPAVAASLTRDRWTVSYLPYDWDLNSSVPRPR